MAFRNEALRRLTNGSIGLAVFTLITLIWPFPSLPYSIYAVLRHQTRRAPHDHDFASTPSFLSWAEVIIAFLLVANIAQSALALQFPPKPIQPKATPARPKATPSTQSSTKRLAGLSPNVRDNSSVAHVGVKGLSILFRSDSRSTAHSRQTRRLHFHKAIAPAWLIRPRRPSLTSHSLCLPWARPPR